MSTTQTGTAAPSSGLVSKQEWAARGLHEITLPSGARVRIRIPDLGRLLARGAVPEGLRAAALAEVIEAIMPQQLLEQAAAETGAPPPVQKTDQEKLDALGKLDELHRYLVAEMLVEPSYTPDELADDSPVRPPDDDLTMLTQIATRERETDALGVTIGVEPVSRWATFREKHGCAEGCEACQAVSDALSTTRAHQV